MALNQPLLPVIGPAPLRDPVTADSTGAPLGPTWQRWFSQIFRAVTSLLGSNPTPALTVAGTEYRWLSVMRIEIPQAALVKLSPILGAQDAGLLVGITDYNHVLEWTGTKFQWGPGESGSNWYSAGPATATEPSANGWHACDGSTVMYLNPDGTLTVGLVLPVTPGMWFRQ